MIDHALRKTCVSVVKVGAEIAIKSFGKKEKRHYKADNSLVTKTDFSAEQAMRKIIKAKFPTHQILGEELGGKIDQSKFTWVIDPIDGTRNFAYGLPVFSCGVAVVQNNQIIASAIGLPYEDAIYSAQLGGGAFAQEKKLINRNKTPFHKSLIGIVRHKMYEQHFRVKVSQPLTAKIGEFRILGSSLATQIYAVTGQLEGMVGLMDIDKPWDIIPGVLIAREAGCEVLDWKGNDWQMGVGDVIIAPPHIARKIVHNILL